MPITEKIIVSTVRGDEWVQVGDIRIPGELISVPINASLGNADDLDSVTLTFRADRVEFVHQSGLVPGPRCTKCWRGKEPQRPGMLTCDCDEDDA